MATVYPDTWFIMKDIFGKHKVPVYRNLNIVREILGLRLNARKRYKEDSVYIVCGREGIGKSTFLLHTLDIYEELTEGKLNIEHLARNIDELLMMINRVQRNSWLGMDEGSELSGERYNEKKAREIKNKFTVMRERAFIIFICFTNPLKIGTYFREDRVRGVFFIRSKGKAWYYSNSDTNPHFTDIMMIWNKEMKVRSIRLFTRFAPDFVVEFPVYEGKYRKEYDERKDTNISKVLETASEFSGNVSISEAGRQLAITTPTVKAWAKKGHLDLIDIKGKARVTLLSIEKCKKLNIFKQNANRMNNFKGKVAKTPIADTSAGNLEEE